MAIPEKTVPNLVREIRKTGAYKTDPQAPRLLLDRLLGWSDMWFYLREFLIVYQGYWWARAGKFGYPEWTSRAIGILRAMEGCGARISISGAKVLSEIDEPAVYVANHMSQTETMLLPGAIILPFQKVTTVVKESLLTYPIFGKIMTALDPVAVTRRNAREDFKHVLKKGTEELKQGISVVLFPQSTRSAIFDPATFNSLGAKLAARAGVPIVPVALRTDFRGIGRTKFLRDFGKLDRKKPVLFRFGDPIPVEGRGKDAHDKAVAFIAATLKEWGCQVREAGKTD